MNMRRIYRKIARAHGVSVEEVKRDMQAAIDHAYRTVPADGVTSTIQQQIPRKDDTPTPDELIRYATDRIRKKGGG